MKKLLLMVAVSVGLAGNARAYLSVEDIPNLTHSITSQIQNYAQYLLTAERELTQITNQVTMIQNQVVSLERFGNPQYYVNLLGLSSFMATANSLTSGVGETIADMRGAAN